MSSRYNHPACPGRCGCLADECIPRYCGCKGSSPLGSMRIHPVTGDVVEHQGRVYGEQTDRMLDEADSPYEANLMMDQLILFGGLLRADYEVWARARVDAPGAAERVEVVSETIVPDTTGRRIAPTQQPTVHNPCPQPGEQE